MLKIMFYWQNGNNMSEYYAHWQEHKAILADLDEFLKEKGVASELYSWHTLLIHMDMVTERIFYINNHTSSIYLNLKDGNMDREVVSLFDPQYREKLYEFCK